jgi:hypothetical protein
MKVYILIIFYALSISCSFGQDITLRVLGFSSYTEYAESNVALISTNDSSLEKINVFKDSLVAKGLNNKLVKIDDIKNSKKIQYKIEEKDKNEFDKLLVLCSDLQIKIDKVYFKMPEHLFEEEDKKAILALNNANSQAKVLANHLGYKIDKILNIDDDTTYSSSIYDDIDFDSERGELLLTLLELLGGRNTLYETESSNSTRNGGYNLWVTYNLKKK